MEKSVNQQFNEVEELISAYRSCASSSKNIGPENDEELENKAIEIVNSLTSIMRNEKSMPEL